ncbi:MAG: hypothetical protein COA58_16855 [Bacteroidetes bacterium]|nr:MAG: hypothetical protein COA58_16855 [Bacteroidota bacterium]
MIELTYLSPAETLLILDPAKSKAEELAKHTFLDLVLRKVLAVELQDASQENPKKTKKLKKIVSIGTNFKIYTPAKHEGLFLSPFAKDTDLKISLRNLIKIAFERIKSTDEYKLKYVYNRRISKYFSANLIQLLIGTKRINTKGLELQKRISDYLSSMDKELKSSKKNVDRLEEKLLSLNSNILLLKNIDNSVFKVLSEIDKKKTEIQNRDDLAWFDYGLLYMWGPHSTSSNFNVMAATTNTFSDSIDSLDTFDSSGIDSTGVSGDGGCSGCGGCGGCGG